MPGLPGSQFPSEDDLVRRVKDLARDVQQFNAANVLATAGIGVIPNGVLVNGLMQFNREDGTLGVQVDPATGTFTAYDQTGAEAVARFGALLETAPGSNGVEVKVGSTWVQVGAQVATWANLAGKPATFPPSGHSHGGGDITSAVANATSAANATKAAQADGSQYGWTNTVAGTEFYALWVGNDGGFHFGRNTSALKYKENVRQLDGDDSILDVSEYLFDRKARYRYPEDEDGNRLEGPPEQILGARDEYGTIADYSSCPELVTWYQGEIDGFRYDLVGLRLIPVVRRQRDRITELENDIALLKQAIRDLGGNI